MTLRVEIKVFESELHHVLADRGEYDLNRIISSVCELGMGDYVIDVENCGFIIFRLIEGSKVYQADIAW